jgi:hypothetical protein
MNTEPTATTVPADRSVVAVRQHVAARRRLGIDLDCLAAHLIVALLEGAVGRPKFGSMADGAVCYPRCAHRSAGMPMILTSPLSEPLMMPAGMRNG